MGHDPQNKKGNFCVEIIISRKTIEYMTTILKQNQSSYGSWKMIRGNIFNLFTINLRKNWEWVVHDQ
jgi:Neuraminidase (sialidase)